MSKPYMESAAADIRAAMTANGSYALDPLTILTFLSLILPLLINLCQKPTPEQGHAHLTWRPDWWIWGTRWDYRSRLERHRRGIEVAARRSWDGTDEAYRNVWHAIWKQIDSERFTVSLMVGLYEESYG